MANAGWRFNAGLPVVPLRAVVSNVDVTCDPSWLYFFAFLFRSSTWHSGNASSARSSISFISEGLSCGTSSVRLIGTLSNSNFAFSNDKFYDKFQISSHHAGHLEIIINWKKQFQPSRKAGSTEQAGPGAPALDKVRFMPRRFGQWKGRGQDEAASQSLTAIDHK